MLLSKKVLTWAVALGCSGEAGSIQSVLVSLGGGSAGGHDPTRESSLTS